MTGMLDHALAYAKLFPIFPCQENGKKPATKHGFKDSSMDEEIVRGWYPKNKNFNIAFEPARANLFIIDDDGADPAFIEKLPPTYTVRTPSGGRHFYYEGTGPSTQDKLAPNVDTRSIGGYALLPPSRTEKGIYEVIDDRDYAPLPAWITEALTKTEKHIPSPSSGEPMSIEQLRAVVTYLEPDAPREEWRDNIAAIHAAPIPDDESEEERRQIAHEYSEGKLDRKGRYIDVSPLLYTDPDSVDQIFYTMPPKVGGVTVGTIINRARTAGYTGPISIAETKRNAALWRNAESIASKSSHPFLLTEEDIFDWPDPEELVEGFIMRNENMCLFGQPKIGKTFIALEIGLSIAAGLPVLGKLKVLTPGPVVYFSGEGHAGMKRRIKAWRVARGIPDDQRLPFYYKANVPSTAAGIEECKRYIEGIQNQLGGVQPVIAIIDTMARSMTGLNENDAGDVGRYLEMTEGLRAGLGCTVLTLAHSGKDEDRGIRGSSASTAGFDAVWSAEMNEKTKAVKLESKWLKDSEDLGPYCFRLPLHFTPELMRLACCPEYLSQLVGAQGSPFLIFMLLIAFFLLRDGFIGLGSPHFLSRPKGN